MTPEEVTHFSHRLADLTVTAARAQTREQLADVREELVDTFAGALTLLAHDGVSDEPAMVFDLNARLTRDDWNVKA